MRSWDQKKQTEPPKRSKSLIKLLRRFSMLLLIKFHFKKERLVLAWGILAFLRDPCFRKILKILGLPRTVFLVWNGNLDRLDHPPLRSAIACPKKAHCRFIHNNISSFTQVFINKYLSAVIHKIQLSIPIYRSHNSSSSLSCRISSSTTNMSRRWRIRWWLVQAKRPLVYSWRMESQDHKNAGYLVLTYTK